MVEQLAAGDEVAFTAIYRYYSPRIFNSAMLYLQNQDSAKDMVQIVFLRLWEKRDKLAAVLSFRDYLFILARNVIFQQLRDQARLERNEGSLLVLEKQVTDDADYKVREAQYQGLLQKGIDALPEQQRKVYKLSRQQNKNIDEIASDLGISRNTARNHLSLALRFMRAYLLEQQHPFVALPLLVLLWR